MQQNHFATENKKYKNVKIFMAMPRHFDVLRFLGLILIVLSADLKTKSINYHMEKISFLTLNAGVIFKNEKV